MPPSTPKARKSRGANLTDDAIESIVRLLDNWEDGKLTWGLLIGQIHKQLRVRYTRQTLDRHARISQAFQARKKAISGQIPKATPEQERIKSLVAENARLERENRNLLEQFHRWLYNVTSISHKHWEEDWRLHREAIRAALDKPLPPPGRQGAKGRDKA
ncbi:MAG: hypothetical protein WC100_08325 [Sterolibacterium sp.]